MDMADVSVATREIIVRSRAVDGAFAGRRQNGLLLGSFDQFFFQSVAFSDVHRLKLLELVHQVLRRSRVVTVTRPLGDALALVGNMTPAFGDVAP
jgi:hypothetical protein